MIGMSNMATELPRDVIDEQALKAAGIVRDEQFRRFLQVGATYCRHIYRYKIHGLLPASLPTSRKYRLLDWPSHARRDADGCLQPVQFSTKLRPEDELFVANAVALRLGYTAADFIRLLKERQQLGWTPFNWEHQLYQYRIFSPTAHSGSRMHRLLVDAETAHRGVVSWSHIPDYGILSPAVVRFLASQLWYNRPYFHRSGPHPHYPRADEELVAFARLRSHHLLKPPVGGAGSRLMLLNLLGLRFYARYGECFPGVVRADIRESLERLVEVVEERRATVGIYRLPFYSRNPRWEHPYGVMDYNWPLQRFLFGDKLLIKNLEEGLMSWIRIPDSNYAGDVRRFRNHIVHPLEPGATSRLIRSLIPSLNAPAVRAPQPRHVSAAEQPQQLTPRQKGRANAEAYVSGLNQSYRERGTS
jgi:hypothetical protein